VTRRALVTGGGGFVGQWLARALLEQGWAVTGAGVGVHEPGPTVLGSEEMRAVTWLSTDIRRDADVEQAITRARPDAVFHLAGVSFIPDARGAPTHAYDVNGLGAARLLGETARQRAAGVIDPVLLIVGSGMQYGRHDLSEMPLRESAEQRPLTVYAASKSVQEIIALQAFRAAGLRVICTRSFNHSGLGHAPHFLLPSLVRRALDIRAGAAPALRIGNASSVRDYLHVSDVVRAYLLLVENGVEGDVYNVCSGIGISACQLAADVLSRVGVTAEITTDPALVRDDDVPVLVGSPAKLQGATEWAPARTHRDIIDDLLHAATR
jgi:GDP-4-dehydro-6-deoxy-D-mannose reductase